MHLLERKRTHFVLWRPNPEGDPPQLVIGTYDPALAPALRGERTLPLRLSTALGDDSGTVWEIAAADCGLESGRVYHYWFLAADTNVYRPADQTGPPPLHRPGRLLHRLACASRRAPGLRRGRAAAGGRRALRRRPARAVRPRTAAADVRRARRRCPLVAAPQQPPGDLRAADRLDPRRGTPSMEHTWASAASATSWPWWSRRLRARTSPASRH